MPQRIGPCPDPLFCPLDRPLGIGHSASVKLRTLVATLIAGLLVSSCSIGSESDTSTPLPTPPPGELDTAPAVPVFVQDGGCNEAVFWAVNAGETIALRISTTVPPDRSTRVVDLAAPVDTDVELQRGGSLRMLLCGDVADETYHVDTSVSAVTGTATISFGDGATLCRDGGYDGAVLLENATFSDGTRIDSLRVASTSIGCFS